MNDPQLVATTVFHHLGGTLQRIWSARSACTRPADAESDGERRGRDRGAVSLEQVLWFVAAGVSVAVIAGLVWSQIRDQANAPIVTPSAP